MTPTFRCSELDRILSCNGSITAAPLVAARTGTEGVEGALLHYLIAKRCIEELGATPPDGGLVAPRLPPKYKLPAFSAWIVDWAFRHIKESVPAGWSLMVEVPLAYYYDLPRPVWMETADGMKELVVQFILSGHIDIFALSPDGTQSKGIDWKTGIIGAEAAETNWQAAGYLGLAKRAWETIVHSEFDLAQPRIDEDAGIPRITTATIEGERLERLNLALAEEINKALENRFETNSGIKQCKYCPVGWRCPSVQADLEFMKANLTPEILAALKAAPEDTMLGDFVIGSRALAGPSEVAEDLLHARLDANQAVVAGCGITITRRMQPGSYEVPDPVAFFKAVRTLLPSDDQIAKVAKPVMSRIQDEIAVAMDLPKTSKDKPSAKSVFDAHLRPLVNQKDKRMLVFT